MAAAARFTLDSDARLNRVLNKLKARGNREVM
jgi:hypothetical protein